MNDLRLTVLVVLGAVIVEYSCARSREPQDRDLAALASEQVTGGAGGNGGFGGSGTAGLGGSGGVGGTGTAASAGIGIH